VGTMVRDRVFTYPDCRSSAPVAEGEVRVRHPDGDAGIAMGCQNCDSASEMTLVLSPKEASALDLHALRNDPEVFDNL